MSSLPRELALSLHKFGAAAEQLSTADVGVGLIAGAATAGILYLTERVELVGPSIYMFPLLVLIQAFTGGVDMDNPLLMGATLGSFVNFASMLRRVRIV